jgi:hypothetical protein
MKMPPDRSMLAVLFWAPRLLGVLFVLFVSMFALDVLVEGSGWKATLAALAIHLIPAAVLFVVLAIAWRFDIAGGFLFALLAVTYMVQSWGHPDWILAISGPLFLIGFLFLLRPIVLIRASHKALER